MSYENRQPPEGINVSTGSPVLEFLLLLGAVVAAIAVLVFALSAAAGMLAHFVPFSVEERLAQAVVAGTGSEHTGDAADAAAHDGAAEESVAEESAAEVSAAAIVARRTAYLTALAQRLEEPLDLPDGMRVHLHYVDQPLINAFATLGGHVFVYQGLIEALSSENALALVIGHEIGHVRARHPIVAAGRGLTVSLALGSLFGLTDSAAVQGLVNWLGLTSSLSFSRSQEREADALAAAAVTAVYGHLSGAAEVFEVFDRESRDNAFGTPELFSTHPDPGARARRLRELARHQGASGPLTPLPADLFRPGHARPGHARPGHARPNLFRPRSETE